MMENYWMYVGLAYGLAFIILAINVWMPWRKHKRLLRRSKHDSRT